jgi:Ca2+-binding RTX toxin-like protein
MLVFSAGEVSAATVSVENTGLALYVFYEAAPGETNAVVFTIDSPTSIRVADSGAPIIGQAPGCVASGSDVVCDVGDSTESGVLAILGDGNDRADLSAVHFVSVGGGPGDDEILGSQFEGSILEGDAGDDLLTGGPGDDELWDSEGGDDRLLGAQGNDLCQGGFGNDTIGGGMGRDDVIGGTGDDAVAGNSGFDWTYAFARNLRVTPTALIGEGNDTLSGVEGVSLDGTSGDDVINARTFSGRTSIWTQAGDDVIVGGRGRDVIVAGAGNDRVAGGLGPDTLWGSRGADLLLSRDRQRDQVNGGLGSDRAHVDRIDHTAHIEAFL